MPRIKLYIMLRVNLIPNAKFVLNAECFIFLSQAILNYISIKYELIFQLLALNNITHNVESLGVALLPEKKIKKEVLSTEKTWLLTSGLLLLHFSSILTY